MAQRKLEIVIAGDSRGAEKAFAKVEKSSRTMTQKMSSVGKKLSLGVTAPLVAGLGLAAKAAAEEEQEVAKLTKTLENNVGATQAQVDAVEEWITKTQNSVAVADSELRPALSKLVIATGSVERSQRLLTTALDISAARGKSLSSVVDSLVRAENGQVAGLSRLGIATKNAAGETLSFDQILRNANEAMGGSAAAAADTASGRMEILRLKFEDLQEELGTAVLPILEKLVGGLSDAATAFSGLTDAQQNAILWAALFLAALGPLITVVTNLKIALVGANMQAGLGGALGLIAAHPIVFAVVALAGAFALAYFHVGWFRDGVDRLIDILDAAIGKVRDLKEALGGGDGKDGGIFGPIGEVIQKGIGNIPLPGPFSGLPNPFKAAGGPVRAGGAYIVGERGPELFSPRQSGTIIPNHALGGGVTVIAQTNADPYQIGREVMWQLGRVHAGG